MYTAPTLPLPVYGEANNRLGKIEAEEGITILFAVESGSRAWGFPSPDSDNDVRFFYTRPVSRYLGLTDPPDVINRPIDGVWDVEGWDLGKALRLMVHKGNATVAEWLTSPLIYREHGPFPYRLRDLMKRHASVEASARHYYGLANSTYKRNIANRSSVAHAAMSVDGVVAADLTVVNLKAYLYAFRSACAISWIERYNEIPPMTMPALMALDIMTEDVRTAITDLMNRKATMGECGTGPRISPLDSFIEEKINWVKNSGFDKGGFDPVFAADAEKLLLDALGIG